MPEVIVDRVEDVQVITINRPAKKNAINAAVARGIADAVDELDSSDELVVAILTGAGGAFSAGMDLGAFLAGETPQIGERGLCGITKAPPRKPLIGAVEGWALGAGLELLLACDLVVASTSARLGLPEVKRSIVAGAGGAYFLPQRVPRAVAMEMLLTGEPITAARALDIGLINRIVPDGGAAAGALELAKAVARNGPVAVMMSKRIATSSADWTRERWWAEQPELMRQVLGSEDAREGARAFVERRAPVWRGR